MSIGPALQLPDPRLRPLPVELLEAIERAREVDSGDVAIGEDERIWAQAWLESAPNQRQPPPFSSRRRRALLGLLEEVERTSHRRAIVAALLGCSPSLSEVFGLWRRLWDRPEERAEVDARLLALATSDPLAAARTLPWLGKSAADWHRHVSTGAAEAAARWLVDESRDGHALVELAWSRLYAAERGAAGAFGRAALRKAMADAPQAYFDWDAARERPAPCLGQLSAALRAALADRWLLALAARQVPGREMNVCDLDDDVAVAALGSLVAWLSEGLGVWDPKSALPPEAWRELAPEARRVVELLWLRDAIAEVLEVFGRDSERAERAEFWRELRPWITGARRGSAEGVPICFLELPGGVLIEFGETGNAAFGYERVKGADRGTPLRAASVPSWPPGWYKFRDYWPFFPKRLLCGDLELRSLKGMRLLHTGAWQRQWLQNPHFRSFIGPAACAHLARLRPSDRR